MSIKITKSFLRRLLELINVLVLGAHYRLRDKDTPAK